MGPGAAPKGVQDGFVMEELNRIDIEKGNDFSSQSG